MSQELKDLLKPPFKCNATGNISGIDSKGIAHLFSDFLPRGENGFALPKKEKEYFDWAACAFTEKYERDFSEPLRWKSYKGGIYGGWTYTCPKCDSDSENAYNYCPHCGQKLLPPKEN